MAAWSYKPARTAASGLGDAIDWRALSAFPFYLENDMRFTVEKVLYFASQDKRLHVAETEASRCTDLHHIVTKEVASGNLRKCGSDDSGDYYECTSDGLIKLYELKISWRRQNGMSTEREESELKRLRLAA